MAATKLKNLSVVSVDLVDQGANPDAHVRLFKRGEQPQDTDPDEGLFQKFLRWLKKGYEDATAPLQGDEPTDGGVAKEAQTFGENLSREQLRHVTSEMFDCCYALSDSFCSILCDDDMDAEQKKNLMLQSLEEFTETVKVAAEAWAAGKKMERAEETATGIQKSTAQMEALAKLLGQYNLGEEPTMPQSGEIEKEVMDTMTIDKSKMTPEEQATLAEFEKKYGVADTPDNGGEQGTQTPDVAKGTEGGNTEGTTGATAPSADVHPEVAKALADFQELTKRQTAEVEELKKSLEMERLTQLAKKYEVIGKKADELAAKLYDLKKAGGTVYDDYVALLDESVDAVTKGGLFTEIGKNTQGSAGTEQTIGIKAAEIAKAAEGMTTPESIIKAFEENPELAAQYEREYMSRR